MKELFDTFEKITVAKNLNLLLLDTCSFIWLASNHKTIDHPKIAMTSFNVLELIHVDHRLHQKNSIRKYLKNHPFAILDIGVVPGNWDAEKKYVNSVDEDLLKHCKDPSDAVLIATAMATNSNVLTRDRHHLYTADLKNFIDGANIEVWKEIKDIR